MNTADITQAIDRGLGALARGDHNQARNCFVDAAKGLLLEAKRNHGSRREHLAAQARRLIEQAARLEQEQGGTEDAGDGAFKASRGGAITLDDVAGLDEVKRAFKAKFIYPLRHPEQAARYNQSGGGGILLYGPPGTGKTFLARALAGELQAPVFSVRPSEIMGPYVGESEQNLAELFSEARKHPLAVIFVDEIDALAPSRSGEAHDVMKRLVPQLLAELDGFQRHDNRLVFIGATNEPWSLDPALMRPGRFDELAYVGLPNTRAREQILAANLKEVYLEPGLTPATIAELTEGYSGADLFGLCLNTPQYAYLDLCENGVERPVTLEDFRRAIAAQPPSVTEEMLAKYAAFGQKRNYK